MENSDISKTILSYSSILNECYEHVKKKGRTIYEDTQCKMYSIKSKEISIYRNGDLFIRSSES